MKLENLDRAKEIFAKVKSLDVEVSNWETLAENKKGIPLWIDGIGDSSMSEGTKHNVIAMVIVNLKQQITKLEAEAEKL